MNKTKSATYSYNPEWEKLDWAKGWLTKNDGQNSYEKQAYCKVCQKAYRAHSTDLNKHGSTQTHQKNMQLLNPKSQPTIIQSGTKQNADAAKDITLAAFIACHSSIKTVDHLSNVLSKLNCKVDLHRTKCTGIIKNLIAPCMLEELIQDVKDDEYSIIVDESTDCAKFKYLCMVIKFFSKSKAEVVTDFLGLIKVSKADADALYTHLKDFFDSNGLELSKIDALGTDGGKNLCGKNHSLYTKLKKHNPNLILLKCVCHSLNLAASHASKEFPSHMDFMLEETYNWFSRSPLRLSEYENLWILLNSIDEIIGEDGKVFHKLVAKSDTRWLAKYSAVKVTREQFFELRKYFSDITKSTEKSYKAIQLCDMYSDDRNYLFLTIVEPILLEINSVNLIFQKQAVEVNTAYDELKGLILLIGHKILKCTSHNLEVIKSLDFKNVDTFKPFTECDYGIEYYLKLRELQINSEQQKFVEFRAFKYFKRLLLELIERLPENLEHFDKLKRISSNVCLSETIRYEFKDLPFIKIFIKSSDLSKVENQYNKLLNVEWKKILTEDELKKSYLFWTTAWNYKNSGGEFAFKELSRYALRVLCLPTSNAVVERVFSVMNIVKTKLRNRMSVELLEAILRIRIHFFAGRICCDTFTPTKKMLSKFNSRVIYPYRYETSENQADRDVENVFEDITNIMDELDWPCIHLKE